MDLAKRVFPVVGMDETGHIVLTKRLTREALLPFIAPLPPLVLGMEACGGAPDWARRFRAHGPTPPLMAPQFVKPSVKANKNDPGDAEAICEAVTRPTRRFVLSFPNTHITCGEHGCGYPVSRPPVSVFLRREGYDYLRRRLRCAGLHSAWGVVDYGESDRSLSSCP
jgi:hypothetical protein